MADGRPSERGIVEVADDSGNVIKGVNRLRLGPGLSASYNPADPSVVIDAIGGSSVSVNLTVDTVSALRSLSSIVMLVAKVAQTSGYSSVGDGGGATYDWYPSNTDADDGALTIKVTAVSTGRWKFRQPANKIFPLAACSIDGTGVTRVGAALSALVSTLVAAGYEGFDGGGRKFNDTGDAYVIPTRPEWYPWKHYRMELTGEGHYNGGTGAQQASISVEIGATGTGAQSPLALPAYGQRTWTETLYAGMDTFTGVSDIRNLSVGDTVLCKYGADPSDAGAPPMFWQLCKIKAITPTTGTAGNIQIEQTVIETPLFPLPAYNINPNRFGNQHDIWKVTGFQDNIYFEDCTLTSSYINAEFARNLTTKNVKGFAQNLCYLFFGCFDTKCSDTYCDSMLGVNVTGGNPVVDPYANFGAFTILNACRNTTFHNLTVENHCTAGGMMDSELNCRGTSFTGMTTVGIWQLPSPSPLYINGGFGATPHNFDIVRFDYLRFENGGQMNNGNMLRMSTLALGQTYSYLPGDPQPAGGSLCAGHVDDVLILNSNEYAIKKSCLVTCIGIPVNGAINFHIPQHGVIREVKVKASSVTGITSFQVCAVGYNGYEEVGNLVAGQWVNLVSPTVLSNVISNIISIDQQIKITTDGTFNANTWISVEVELFTLRRKYDGTDSYSDTSVPAMISFSGAPNVSATFVGQTAICNGATSIYAAVTAGNGAADWVKLSGVGDALTSQPLSQFASTTSAQLRGVMSDETGTGALVFAGGNIGAATATSVNKVALTAPATSATLTVADGKTLTASDDATIGGIFKIAGGSFSGSSPLSASWAAGQYSRLELTLNVAGAGADPAITLTGISSGTYNATSAYLTAFAGSGLWSQNNVTGGNDWKLPDFTDGGAGKLVFFPIRATGSNIRCVSSGLSGQALGTFGVFAGITSDTLNSVTGINIAFGASANGQWELWGYK